MNKPFLLFLSALVPALSLADPIEINRSDRENGNLPIRLPRRPGMSSPLSVDKGESSILIEYDAEVTVLSARIIDDSGNVVYEDQTSSSSLELPLPPVGDYTIEVQVDDTLYIGEFSVED